MIDSLNADLTALAKEHGAVSFGVASAAPFRRELSTLDAEKRSGRSGRLRFTYDDPVVATDVRRTFPWARRVAVVGWAYVPQSPGPAPSGAMVGRFATRDHYEGVREVTNALAGHLRSHGHRAEVLIDDNRLLDRAAAIRAGIGWAGKSTMVLAPGHGPWMLLGSVVTDAPLAITAPMEKDCGSCTRCIPACPTNALGDGRLDARRCLSAWLQTPGSIPHWIRPLLGRRIYGCDECLIVCPPGRPAMRSRSAEAVPLPFAELLESTDEELLERFHWWYVPRRQGRFIRRNLLVAAGNAGESGSRGPITSHLSHESSMIRGHAAWALARGWGQGALDTLHQRHSVEKVPQALDEMTLALLMLEYPMAHRDLLSVDEWVGTSQEPVALALTAVESGTGAGDGVAELLVLSEGVEATPPPTVAARVVMADVETVGPSPILARVSDPHRKLDEFPRAVQYPQPTSV